MKDERQKLVNKVFASCMALDERALGEIRKRVREEVALLGEHHPLHRWAPSDHQLQIMISRNCMGEGEWQYFPAYSNPPRYVSRERVRQLCAIAENRNLLESKRRELKEQLADLDNGIRHWRAKHNRARQKEAELRALVDDISMRAFAGHHTELV